MTELAEFGLQEDERIEYVVLFEGEVEVRPFDLELPDERKQMYQSLFERAGVFGFRRWDGGVALSRGGERFDREFTALYFYPASAPGIGQDCSKADFSAEGGECIVPLSGDWVVRYQWDIPLEYVKLKCLGVLRQHSNTLEDREERLRLNQIEEYLLSSQRIEPLGESVVDHWISAGAAEYAEIFVHAAKKRMQSTNWSSAWASLKPV